MNNAFGINRFFSLFSRECCLCFLLKVQVCNLFDCDSNETYCTTLECPGRFVLMANSIAAVIANAQPVAREGEFACLCSHGSLGNNLVVDIKFHGTDRFVMVSGFLADKLHAKGIFAGFEGARNEFLFRHDAKEVVDIVKFAVFDKQGMASESRTMCEYHT